MDMEEKINLRDESVWSYNDLMILRKEVAAEIERRQTLQYAHEEIVRVLSTYQEAQGRQDGDAWVKPTGYLDAYLKDALVEHDGKTWRSTRDGASEEPGKSPDWIEVTPEGVIPEWEQRHAGSEWDVGALVVHNGHVWRNDHTGPNGWEPGTAHSQWTDLGPVDEYIPD